MRFKNNLAHIMLGIVIFFCMMLINVDVIADTNVDTGGGGTGGNTDSTTNVFSSGDFGVRFTIVNADTGIRSEGTRTIDYYKKDNKIGKAIYHFNAKNKLEYLNGETLEGKKNEYFDGTGSYASCEPKLWNVIESSAFGAKATLSQITNWLSTDINLKKIASDTYFNYDKLTSGDYLLLAEPILYVTYGGKYYAMTAHEIAKYDEMLNGDLRRKFGTYSHKNIPLSLFLKKKRLGIKPWLGSKTQITTNDNIKSYLGIAIMAWDKPEPDLDLTPAGDYTYRTNTDVISAIDIKAYGEANPDNPVSVTFSIPNVGVTMVTGILIPSGYTQRVWCKWRTPSVPQTVVIDVSTNGNAAKSQIVCKVKKLGWHEPLNPTADDVKPKDFKQNPNPADSEVAKITPVSSVAWTKWERCVRESELVGYNTVQIGTDAKGNPIYSYVAVYDYYWHFGTGSGRHPGEPTYYTASIRDTTKLEVVPGATASKANTDKDKLKSGYGIGASLKTQIITNASTGAVTPIQSAIFYFPEFNYQSYSRLGEMTQRIMLDSVLELPKNLYSIYRARTHFTPLWFPDSEYKLYTKFYDSWTPAGMLQSSAEGSIAIKGSVFDDFHIGIIPNN